MNKYPKIYEQRMMHKWWVISNKYHNILKLFVESANCDSVKCKDRQVCLSDLITHRPRCVSCSFKCPRRKRPQVYYMFMCFHSMHAECFLPFFLYFFIFHFRTQQKFSHFSHLPTHNNRIESFSVFVLNRVNNQHS